ncbi:MAG: nicotinate (nicotinamide) nucleotide adenylyltransferase [Phycisphaerales bacterium]|nr:nicotinate (nicotinamide) nucleotide adenylyltransferase [Phycisphaerales bacterium]
MSARKVLVFGGSFNPPHRRHVSLAQQAAEAIGADEIRVIPANINPQRQEQPTTSAHHREAMLRLAFAGQARAVIDTQEIARGGASFTVDTLKNLRAQFPDAQFFLLLGGDQALNFYSWKDPQGILALATPVVVPRAPLNAPELLQQIAARKDTATANVWRPWILPLEAAADSSTQLRDNIVAGAALDEKQIDPAVTAYIKRHSLYM